MTEPSATDLLPTTAPAGRPGRHAVLVVGGRGVRLRPYTSVVPKPLVPVGDDHSVVEIILRQLAAHGFTRATLALGHLGHLIRAYVGDGSQWGIGVDYVQEETPLGTIGPALTILDRLPDDFLLMNGDIITDLDYADMFESHVGSGDPVTVACHREEYRIDYGVLEIADSRIIGFQEKPSVDCDVSMGVYVLSRRYLWRYQPGAPLGFDQLVLDLIDRGTPPGCYLFDGLWIDIGNPDEYERVNREFPRIVRRLLPAAP